MSLNPQVSGVGWIVLAGDIAALVAFGLIGLASHEDSVSVAAVSRSILPFVVLWLITAPFYPGVAQPNAPRGALGQAWTIAGVTALVARSVFFDREFLTAFLVIAFVGNFLFLFAWRTVFDWFYARRYDATQR